MEEEEEKSLTHWQSHPSVTQESHLKVVEIAKIVKYFYHSFRNCKLYIYNKLFIVGPGKGTSRKRLIVIFSEVL